MRYPVSGLMPPLLALALLAACNPVPAHQVPFEGRDTCGARPILHLVGEPENVLGGLALGDQTRIIHPGEAVTMDYSPTRLNIAINSLGRIERISCG